MRKAALLTAVALASIAASVQAQAPRRPAAPAPAPARAPVQVVTGPVSTYWVSAETTAGFGAGLMGGGGAPGARPSFGSIMGAMRGAGSVNHRLTLQLGSSRTAPAPAADHAPPAALAVGPKLPLLTPRVVKAEPVPQTPGEVPREYQRPRGRMLIFWGCSERARPGQPLVLDFAELSSGRVPAGALSALKGLNYTPMQPPSPGRHATYGEWPNERTTPQQQPSAASSLVGPHLVTGNYSSNINFMLTPGQDFLPALGLRSAKAAAGGAQLTWTPAQGARGYAAMAVGAGGGGGNETVALWISSDAQAAGFGLPDYLSPSDVDRLVREKALMPAGTASCAMPKEFVDVAPTAFINLVGYGDEANFSYPPRPADPRTPWNIDWTTKVRYRTAESAILGMDMGAMGGGSAPAPSGFPGAAQSTPRGFPVPGGGAAPAPAPTGENPRDAVIRGLGSALGRGLLGR
jgi:hypothetical protein